MVKKITKDTVESGKLREKTKKLIAAVSVLAVMILATLYLFFGWSGEVNKAEQVKEIQIVTCDGKVVKSLTVTDEMRN